LFSDQSPVPKAKFAIRWPFQTASARDVQRVNGRHPAAIGGARRRDANFGLSPADGSGAARWPAGHCAKLYRNDVVS